MTRRRDESIVVLGGGVSGLVFASTLQKLGFTRVCVLEKSERVGGKCLTLFVDGLPHDMGATMGVPKDYDKVLRIAQRGAIQTVPFPREMHFRLSDGQRRTLNRKRDAPKIIWQAAKYCYLQRFTWTGVRGDGLENASPELHASWQDVARRRGLEAISERLLTYRAGYGYGFDDEVPAAMYANSIRTTTLSGLASGRPFMWRGGTQGIWEVLSRELDIRTGVDVKRVRRSLSRVTVDYSERGEAGSLQCDRIVIAFNPREALPLLDATVEEEESFGAIRTYPYATFAAKVRGVSDRRSSVGYLHENMAKERMGHPMAWVKRYSGHDVFVFHLFAPEQQSDQQIDEKIRRTVQALGGTLISVLERRRWSFFPHYTPKQFRYVRAVDERQGRNRMVVLGEAFSFASMARVAEHAERTARRFAADEFRS